MSLEGSERKERGAAPGGRTLLIFSHSACCRRFLPEVAEGSFEVFLPREDTGLSADVTMRLVRGSGGWWLGGKELGPDSPFYFNTGQKEKLLLVLAQREEVLHPAEKIFLKREEELQIGSAFRNRIFYECFSLTQECHARIRFSGQGFVLSGQPGKGIYVNGRALCGETVLHTGDEVAVYGLHLLVLGEMLVCTCHGGIFRVAGSREAAGQGMDSQKMGNYNAGVGGNHRENPALIERICGQEEALMTGEVEVLLPEKQTREKSQPLFLTLGPSLTMVLPMLLMAELGSRYMGDGSGGFYYLSVVMSGCSAVLSLFWGLAGHGYQKREQKKEGRERERSYREYLREQERWLISCQEKNRSILLRRYPPLSIFSDGGQAEPSVLWNRYYRQKGFLFLRLGVGDVPFQMKVHLSSNSREIVENRQVLKARELTEKFRFLKQAPVGIDLKANRQLGVTGSTGKELCEGLLQLLMQTAACHCYTEVKLALFYRKDRYPDREIAGCIRWLPHLWSVDRQARFLAGDERETGEILPVLTREITKNPDAGKGACIPWYIVLVLDPELIRGEPLYGYLTDPDGNCPVSAVFAGKSREELPKSCRCFWNRKREVEEILYLEDEEIRRQPLQTESCDEKWAQEYARGTSGFRVRENGEEEKLPEKVDFLQLFGCRQVEELESGRRWTGARTGERLKAPLGMGAGGRLVSLDVHEKFHGPHGLIAGTTGSGKSELLQTFLLSMAVSYGPADVNFFMIDYKGGGTGNLLKNLPHCAGVISNLSGKQIKRAMSAITSENRRRQRLFSEYQVNHIDAYTRLYREGRVSRAMPHLLLVVDEFAELKKEEPEFMQEIISLAQVGRSLGMHLILATQKPAGTVDERIWSNARFRLCLRVQDGQDSMDMLHNKDAALLTAPGQCYLQIGNHEYYELFQAGYCGGVYREGGEEKGSGKAVLLSDTGKRHRLAAKKREQESRSQIEAITDYIILTAEKYHCPAAEALWLPELPEKIFLEELSGFAQAALGEAENEASGGKAVVEARAREPELYLGLCDDPENQCRTVLTWQPVVQGHLALCAGPATGKTAFLQTVLWQLCHSYTPREAQVIVVDLGEENLGGFCAMPHCLGVLREKEGKDVFFYHLEKLLAERKRLLPGISCAQYNRSGRGALPHIFLAVDNFERLKKIWDEKQEELFTRLASEGPALGIFLLLTAAGVSGIGGKLYDKFKMALALELSDRFQYGDVLRQYYLPVLPEENRRGRGLCRKEGRVLEFQAVMIGEGQEDYACFGRIEEAGRRKGQELRDRGEPFPEKFPMLPEKVDFKSLAADFEWKGKGIPLGYSLSTGEVKSILPEETVCFLVSGREKTGRGALLGCLIEGTLRRGDTAVVLDDGNRLAHFKERQGVIYLKDEREMENWRSGLASSGLEGEVQKNVHVFIGNLGKFCRSLYRGGEYPQDERTEGACRERRADSVRFWERAARGDGCIRFLTGIYHPDRDYEVAGTVFFREFSAWQQGICLGGGVAEQRELSFDDLSYSEQNRREKPGTGYLKEGAGSGTCRLRVPL